VSIQFPFTGRQRRLSLSESGAAFAERRSTIRPISSKNEQRPVNGYPICRVFVLSLFAIALQWGTLHLVAAEIGAGRSVIEPVPLGPLYPAADQTVPRPKSEKTCRGQAAVAKDGASEVRTVDDGRPAIWPRVALAKLYLGQDVDEVNRTICSIKPWKESGSSFFLHPNGDYDFFEIDFVALLYLLHDRPDRLYPNTARYIVENLLIEDGAEPRLLAPLSLGLGAETENHILMTETTRYLRNQWRFHYGSPEQRGNAVYDNGKNGLGTWLAGHLRALSDAGLYEYNSIPYFSFTMRALLNLDAFADDPRIAATARRIVDFSNWQYALGSLDLRRCAPFRRQPRRAGLTGLRADAHTPFMLVWTSGASEPNPLNEPPRPREETIAELMPYRLPDAVRRWALQKPESYFVRFGHGKQSSPELYSGGPDFLLSAGGAARGRLSMIAARPTSLLLRDGATDLRDCFHITGKGGWESWNNTGVCERFACGNGAVNVPKSMCEAARSGTWSAYEVPCTPGLLIAVHNQPGVALLAVFPGKKTSAAELAQKLANANPDESELQRFFHWPDGGSISYDIDAPQDKWVITTIDGQPVDRALDNWPQIEGHGPHVNFQR
jgi:hypothetical protein